MTDIIKALEALKKLELTIRDLYSYYHKLFFDRDKEASDFFSELSDEEKSHADLIDYQVRTIRKNRSLFKDVEFDISSLNELIASIESRISSREPVSLNDALKYGLELESDALENYFKTLIAKSNPEIAELIKRLGTADREHFDKLRVLAINRGFL